MTNPSGEQWRGKTIKVRPTREGERFKPDDLFIAWFDGEAAGMMAATEQWAIDKLKNSYAEPIPSILEEKKESKCPIHNPCLEGALIDRLNIIAREHPNNWNEVKTGEEALNLVNMIGLTYNSLLESYTDLQSRFLTADKRTSEAERERDEAKKRICEHCGSNRLYSGPPDCPGCGAPNCCQTCCQIAALESNLDTVRRNLSSAEKERDEARKALEPLVKMYLANPGTEYEFVSMVGSVPGTLNLWRKAKSALNEKVKG